MKNKCEKHRFPTELDAKIALMKIQHKDNPRRLKQEKRVYLCAECAQWHLTSIESWSQKTLHE